jgi:hypothetical protein
MFDVTVRTMPHFVFIWYLSTILKVSVRDINVITAAFVGMVLSFIWNNKNKSKKWYWKLDYTYMTAWALLEMVVAMNHPDIGVFLTTAFINQFVFFTNSIIDRSDTVPKWKYVLWNNMCFAKTALVMGFLRKVHY